MQAFPGNPMNLSAHDLAAMEDQVRHHTWDFMMNHRGLLMAFVDKNLKFTVVNRALAKAVSHAPQKIYGKAFSDLFPQKELTNLMLLARRRAQTTMDYGRSWPWSGIKKSGERYWDWMVQPLSNSRHSRQGYMLVWQEVSDRKKSELENEQASLKAQQVQRMEDINKLAAILAHELRNPLSVILAAVYNIRRRQSSPEVISHLDRVNKKVAESQKIINNILLYANLKQPQFNRVQVLPLLKESLQSIRLAFAGQPVSLRTRYLNLAGQKIYVDPLQFREVVTNLLWNAFQAVQETENPSINLSASMDKHKTLTVRIRDNGSGLKETIPEKLMEPFFTTKARGTGLGLAICKQILDHHRGTLAIANHPQGGVVVTFKLYHQP